MARNGDEDIEPGQRLGAAPVVTTVFKKVGEVLIEQVLEKLIGDLLASPDGGFTSQSNEISLYSQISPPDRLFKPCTIDFPLMANIPFLVEHDFWGPKVKENVKKNFWFRLSYSYNGNDLRNVKILPLFAKTGKLGGHFHITFEGSPYEIDGPNKVKFAQVSKVRFGIAGSWKPPGSDTTVTIQGFLTVWGNGHAGIVISAEKNWVSADSGFKPCPMLPHYQPPPLPAPKPPVRKPYSFTVLFPIRSKKVSEEAARGIANWWNTEVPKKTQEKIIKGDITVSIIGFASRPGTGLYNLRLSGERATNVHKMLRKHFFGPNAKFDPRSYGEYIQNLPDLFDVIQWLKRAFDPNKYDQAAVIRFEDVE
jgi:hypothetical protein